MFGSIKFEGKGCDWEPQRVDRIAVDDDGYLLFVSMVADFGIIKGVRGALNTDTKVGMTIDDIEVARPSRPDLTRQFSHVNRRGLGYHGDIFKIGLNMAHAFFWSKDWGLLLGTSDDHLWAALRDVRFTTPLLREWVPYVKSQLLIKGMLKEAYCWNCECGVLDLLTPGLDNIVSEGVRSRALPIPENAA